LTRTDDRGGPVDPPPGSEPADASNGAVIHYFGHAAPDSIAPSDRLDVCMTALRRPELLALTLESFSRRVFRQWRHVRLIANIDPLGDPSALAATLELMAHYPHEALVRVSARGNFTDAVRWCWRQASAPMVLHLEDDWLCLRRVSRVRVERAMAGDRVGAVRLYLRRVPFRRRKREIGFTLNPCFFDARWLAALAERLDDTMDPEKQIRWKRGPCASCADAFETVMYGAPGHPRIVMDIGRDWRERRGLVKELIDGQAVWIQRDAKRASLSQRLSDRWLAFRARFP
jgi:hypothetical protein